MIMAGAKVGYATDLAQRGKGIALQMLDIPMRDISGLDFDRLDYTARCISDFFAEFEANIDQLLNSAVYRFKAHVVAYFAAMGQVRNLLRYYRLYKLQGDADGAGWTLYHASKMISHELCFMLAGLDLFSRQRLFEDQNYSGRATGNTVTVKVK